MSDEDKNTYDDCIEKANNADKQADKQHNLAVKAEEETHSSSAQTHYDNETAKRAEADEYRKQAQDVIDSYKNK